MLKRLVRRVRRAGFSPFGAENAGGNLCGSNLHS